MRSKFGRVAVMICVLVMLFALTSISHATTGDNEGLATDLKELGLFNGTDKGFELEKVPTRVQAAAMLVKLLGGESEALAKKYAHPFKDVPAWASDYVGYMYEKGLTKGISATMFGSNNNASAKDFSTFMLKALGYKDGDFTYNDVLNFAKEKGLVSTDEFNKLTTSTFTRNEMVLLAHNTLDVTFKGSEDRLIDRLVDAKVVSINVANSLKYYDYPTVPMEVTKGENSSLRFEIHHERISPEILDQLVFYSTIGSNMKLDMSTTEKLAKLIFISDFEKTYYQELAKEYGLFNPSGWYSKSNYFLNSFMGKDLEVAYYFEIPTGLSPGTYDLAMIKPNPELDKRLKELTVEYKNYYTSKMKSLVIMTPEMYNVVKKEDGNNYISFNKDKMPAELAKFTGITLGFTSGGSEIDYQLVLKSEFIVLGSPTRAGLSVYNDVDPILVRYNGNIIVGFYDDNLDLLGVGMFFVNE
ncbi:S-layer homology domain-containing protein [Fusibacter bizertensis]|uniref:S-layer homology domain-containing protein n=1 Tax=Fusibacter bizertensis TaxID=1488331 RepID=A0ABT6NE76_9FIRM|nr:S-layer homology domain-containing protein [Fusibacter bizertensis]MDH8678728.1 S-layer homology domain-containing protein [Fusibacter bizertensis]